MKLPLHRVAYEAEVDRLAAGLRDRLDRDLPSTAEWIREDSSLRSTLRLVIGDIADGQDRTERDLRLLAWMQLVREMDR